MGFKLTEENLKKVKAELTRYEEKLSSILPVLFIAQTQNGWINSEVIDHLSEVTQIPQSRIWEVAQFYTMYNKEPVGKYHIQICNNISCAMANSRELTSSVLKKLNLKLNQMSVDKKYTISSVECLGDCDHAPMMQINDDYYGNLNEGKVEEILKGLK